MYRLVVFLYLLAIAFGVYIPKDHCLIEPKTYFPSGKIVGGAITPIEDVPYQVAILVNGHQFCGGSIIGTKHILSAGHCFKRTFNASKYTVRTGSSERHSGGTVIKVKSYKVHPKYDKQCGDYDVSVIELEEDIQLNSRSAIVILADTEAVSGNALVSGWGAKRPADRIWLYSVVVPIVSRTVCERAHANSYRKITARMICAGEAGKGSWYGDSGGPLVAGKKDTRTQVGIVSWGPACSEPYSPYVYTNIADPEIRSFIKEEAGV